MTQTEMPQQLRVLVEAIFQQQFRKLAAIFEVENFALVSTNDNETSELACITAIKEGIQLELAPLQSPVNTDDPELSTKQRIYEVLQKQPLVKVLSECISESALIEMCSVMFFIFDREDSTEVARFDNLREIFFFGNETRNGKSAKLTIEINLPKKWTSDADDNVYFDYYSISPKSNVAHTEIEIPDLVVSSLKKRALAVRH